MMLGLVFILGCKCGCQKKAIVMKLMHKDFTEGRLLKI
jgi:hypothetical protein